MPTYANICSCGKEFEIEQKITDSPLKTCPFGENGSCKFSKSKPQKVKRLVVSGNFILMGEVGIRMDIPSLAVRKKTLSRNKPITRKAVAKNLAHVKVRLGLLVVCS